MELDAISEDEAKFLNYRADVDVSSTTFYSQRIYKYIKIYYELILTMIIMIIKIKIKIIIIIVLTNNKLFTQLPAAT